MARYRYWYWYQSELYYFMNHYHFIRRTQLFRLELVRTWHFGSVDLIFLSQDYIRGKIPRSASRPDALILYIGDGIHRDTKKELNNRNENIYSYRHKSNELLENLFYYILSCCDTCQRNYHCQTRSSNHHHASSAPENLLLLQLSLTNLKSLDPPLQKLVELRETGRPLTAKNVEDLFSSSSSFTRRFVCSAGIIVMVGRYYIDDMSPGRSRGVWRIHTCMARRSHHSKMCMLTVYLY